MTSAAYGKSVFINCSFDTRFKPLFRAIVFTVIHCSYIPRSALEHSDGGEPRIQKIERLIGDCRFGIHDISRVELDRTTGLPRFNMPFELGLFLGARRHGVRKQRDKICLILDKERYRYQKFLSDISGQDIYDHGSRPARLIEKVRDWLSNHNGTATGPLPGGETIARNYDSYRRAIPDLAEGFELSPQKLTYSDELFLMREWRDSLPASFLTD